MTKIYKETSFTKSWSQKNPNKKTKMKKMPQENTFWQ